MRLPSSKASEDEKFLLKQALTKWDNQDWIGINWEKYCVKISQFGCKKFDAFDGKLAWTGIWVFVGVFGKSNGIAMLRDNV